MTYYPKETLVWSGILLFLLGLGSRRQFRFESKTPAFVDNLNALAGADVQSAPHDDTLVYYLAQVDPQEFQRLPVDVVRRLIRMKALDRWRLHGRFLVAVDATGHMFFRERHCPHCLTSTGADGRTLYYHHVLEAKLITASGLVFSIATEFIENADPDADSQDCELKAFARLAKTLKSHFPQLPILLLADALYACKPVFDICRRNKWHFIFTLKEGSLPALFGEFETLRDLSPQNRTTHRHEDVSQQFAWVNDLEHKGGLLSAFECREQTDAGEEQHFTWITDLRVGCASVVTLANRGGRIRWKIENEGFNIQKNHGYELEHAYSTHEWAVKNLYLLLQVAHAINQLMTHGSLLPNFYKLLGSLRNYLRRLAESIRRSPISPTPSDSQRARAFQVRLDPG